MPRSIKEVAKLAGVTNGTVSRAFNGYADILPETKERILSAAKALGYTPNVNARSLSAKRPPNIGLIISGMLEGDPKDNLIYLMLQGVLCYAQENQLEVALYATDSIGQRNKSYVDFCREHSISGAILSGITTDDVYMEELIDSGIPSVAIDVPIKGDMAGWVSIDNKAAAQEMIEHLLKQGHRDIAVVNGKRNAAVNKLRLTGVEHAMAAAGLAINPERMLYGSFDEHRAYNVVADYLKKYGNRNATAFFCFSDIMAIGTLRAITEAGYSVPKDFSLAGFDGLPISELTTPALTTIAQDMRRIGQESAAMLHDMLRDRSVGEHHLVPHRLTIRSSVRAV